MLKPCPFCGGEAEFERLGTPRQSCIVQCTNCACTYSSNETFDCGTLWNEAALRTGILEIIETFRDRATAEESILIDKWLAIANGTKPTSVHNR
jgi:hypothetical protein